MCIQIPVWQTGKEGFKEEDYTALYVRMEGKSIKEASYGPTLGLGVSEELSHTLRHVQRGQHLFKNGSFHIGPSQVGFL